jgi:adenylate cyclase
MVMAFEPERKYLVNLENFLAYLNSDLINGEEKLIGDTDIMQAYLNNSGDWIAKIKISGELILSSVSADMKAIYRFDKADTKQLLEYDTTKMIDAETGLIDPKSWVSRIRIYNGHDAEICLKERVAGDNRGECEDMCHPDLAHKLFSSVKERIAKKRYFVMKDGYKWEVDVFRDLNEGLCIAELETKDKEYQWLSFIEYEITDEIRYYNDELSKKPYSTWKK